MRSSNNSSKAATLLGVAAVKPPALMETLQLLQQAALVLLFQPRPQISASRRRPVLTQRSHQCWLFSRRLALEQENDSEPAVTAAMTLVQRSSSVRSLLLSHSSHSSPHTKFRYKERAKKRPWAVLTSEVVLEVIERSTQ